MSQNIDHSAPILTNPELVNEPIYYLSKELWDMICSDLQSEMNIETFELWIKPVKPLSYQNKKLMIEVPNKLFCEWIRTNCQEKIELFLRENFGQESILEILIAQDWNPPPKNPKNDPPSPAKLPEEYSSTTDLFNSKYTFETFVEGQSNRFAKAAAEGVSKEPGIRFNPFFLYGGVGLGKTHLMHAITHTIRQNNPSSQVLYITSEKFINEFIDSLRFERPSDFRNKYRKLDCLLIDDIQFLIGKGRSLEEFFNTFNTLFDSKKQIVISSDRPPKELGALQDRLISRFQWGVVADIQPPDLETRIAILRNKAELDKTFVPEDVILFIAGQVRSNIRELEGSLTRIVAYSSLTGTPLTVDSARATLKDILSRNNPDRPISLETIQEVVAKHFNLDLKELRSKRRTDAIAWPRQIAMYITRTLTELSTTEIGESFGGKDHTTVLHACEKVKLKLAENPFISSLVNKITQEIKNSTPTES